MTIPDRLLDFQVLAYKKLRSLDLLAYKGALTKDLKMKILTTNDLTTLEDLHDSYSSNGQAKEYMALKLGVDHLASILWRQERNVDPRMDALAFFDEKTEIKSQDQALAVARDILAEKIRDNKEAKKELRNFVNSTSTLAVEIIREDHPELNQYTKYFPTSALPLTETVPDMAQILEAESKGIVVLLLNVPQEDALKLLDKFFIKKETACGQQVRMALKDSYERFLLPYIEVEIRSQLVENALVQMRPKKKLSAPLLIIPAVLLSILVLKDFPHPIPDGVQKQYYSSGLLKSEAAYKNSQLDGIAKKYYPNGQIMSIEGYSNGKPDGGFRKFLSNGQIVLFVTYKNGVLDGESREYYDNGEWKTVKNYQDGQLEGFAQEYDQDGHLKRQIYYHNNIPLPEQR